jgi:hypothetical protein
VTTSAAAPPAGSLAGVLPGALAALGMPGVSDPLALADQLGAVRQVAVLLMDGLGYHLLAGAARTSPTIAEVLEGTAGALRELSSPFPSTTPTSLVTLGTGVLPGVHGIVGFTVNVPGTDRVLTHIDWRDDPPPREWQPAPRLLEKASTAGISTAVVGPRGFAGSGLTTAAYGAARYVGTKDLARAVGGELRAGTQLVYGYHANLDTMAHLHGIASEQWSLAAAEVGRIIAAIAKGLPPDSALLVTADHGGVDIPRAGRIDLDADRRLAAGVRVVAGEPRVRYLHTVDGAAQDVLAAWRDVLGDRALVASRDELIEGGWFGPVLPQHIARIGDVVVVCHGETVVLATDHEPTAVANLVAFHGAITPEETAVPLITFRS